MARIPILAPPGQIDTGNHTQRTPNLSAVTNAAIGQGIAKVGEVVSDIQQKAARANDVTHLTNASLAMNKAQQEFATFQQKTPDESKWLPEWEKLTSGLQTQIAEMPLTPEGRAQLTTRFSDWSTRGTINVQAQGFRQAESNADQAIQNAIVIGQQTGDFTTARQALNDRNAALPLPEEERQARELQIAGAERKFNAEEFEASITMARERFDGLAMMDAVMRAEATGVLPKKSKQALAYVDEANRMEAIGSFRDIANTDPIVAKSKLSKGEFPQMTPDERDRAEAFADGKLRDFQQREANGFAEHVLGGQSPDDFQFAWNYSLADQAKLRDAARFQPKLTEAEAATLRLELDTAINSWSKESDPTGIEAIRISAKLNAAKNAMPFAFSDLGDEWGNRGRTTSSAVKMEIANNDAYLQRLYQPRMQALLVQDEGPNKGSIKPGKEAEFRALQAEVTKLKQMYKKGLGSDPTPEKARKLSQDILTAPVAEDVTDYFYGRDDEAYDFGAEMGAGIGDTLGGNPLLPSLNAPKKPLPGQ